MNTEGKTAEEVFASLRASSRRDGPPSEPVEFVGYYNNACWYQPSAAFSFQELSRLFHLAETEAIAEWLGYPVSLELVEEGQGRGTWRVTRIWGSACAQRDGWNQCLDPHFVEALEAQDRLVAQGFSHSDAWRIAKYTPLQKILPSSFCEGTC